MLPRAANLLDWTIFVALFACLIFFGTRGGLVVDSNEDPDLTVEDEIPEAHCDVEFNPEWVAPKTIPVAPFHYYFSDVCYDFQRFPTQSKEPYDTLGKKLFEAYSALGVQTQRLEAYGNHTTWEFQCTTEFRKLVTAHAWLAANGNIFDSSTAGPDFNFWMDQPLQQQPLDELLVSQAFSTLKIESDSFFYHSDVAQRLTPSLFSWLGTQPRLTKRDLEILDSFARGLRMGLSTLHTMDISEWNMVHLANIHRTVCTAAAARGGSIRTSGLMMTGERVCAPAGLEVPHLMRLYINWLHYTAKRVKSGCMKPVRFGLDAYLNLLFIHPWADCNGRMSRIVLIFILMKFDLPPPSLDYRRTRDEILEALHEVQELAFAGDREPFYGTFMMWMRQTMWQEQTRRTNLPR